ncbi:hypothetical protein [Streptomyces sp. NBC_01314]|uniref:hypothetical protein n=1 Tax=Streptomyces sp. NBC_01314 TaxID=2903821 RepID=UPI00308D06FC|nr:hypothetical protein OG622_13180 [Streptomyces sp. NBC_01314]
MNPAATSLMPVVVVIAALVIRTAIGEIRRPGSARKQWAFVASGRAMTAGLATTLVIAVMGWQQAGAAILAWALLAGGLVAFLLDPPRT